MLWLEIVCDNCSYAMQGHRITKSHTYSSARQAIIKEARRRGWKFSNDEAICPGCVENGVGFDDLPQE